MDKNGLLITNFIQLTVVQARRPGVLRAVPVQHGRGPLLQGVGVHQGGGLQYGGRILQSRFAILSSISGTVPMLFRIICLLKTPKRLDIIINHVYF